MNLCIFLCMYTVSELTSLYWVTKLGGLILGETSLPSLSSPELLVAFGLGWNPVSFPRPH